MTSNCFYHFYEITDECSLIFNHAHVLNDFHFNQLCCFFFYRAMFIKPFRIKSSTQMKGSDKKKFKAEIRKRFPYFTDPDVDQDLLNDLMPNKEELMVTKVETYGGDHVLLYQKQKNVVLFFELEKDKLIFPTLYTLWQCPSLLMTMSTYSPVVQKMANGADLMLPGIVVNESLGMKAYCDGKIKKDDIMSVNLVNNKACVAVGMSSYSSEDMYMSGKRGKALRVLHCFGDQLWVHLGKPTLPDLGVPDNLDFLKETDKVDEDNLDDESDEKKEDEEYSGDSEDAVKDEDANGQVEQPEATEETSEMVEQVADDIDIVEVAEQIEDVDLNAEPDFDAILFDAFLRACKTMPKKTEFPILTSNFFRTFIIPNCPPSCPNLDVKKTKWKKLSKFLSEQQKDGLLTIKEQKKGVEVISAINQEHPKIQEYRVVKYETVPDDSKATNGDKEEFEPPVITELYIVNGGDVAEFFKACKINKGCGMTSQEVRECVREYVNQNGLQHPTDKTIINLDPVIAHAVLVKGENNVLTFRWDKLHSRITAKMSKGFAIQYGSNSQPIVMKGKLDLIEMTVGSRSGNKKVTLIHNLDVFGIKPQEFAHKCQVGVAASSTIHEAPNKKKSNGSPVIEVLVQGNQVAFAGKLLMEVYKIPKKYIRGLELADNKKGKGKK